MHSGVLPKIDSDPLGPACSERRTQADRAEVARDFVAVQYPDAEKIVPVMNNLNIHWSARAVCSSCESRCKPGCIPAARL